MELKYVVNSIKYKNVKEVLKNHFYISDRFLIKLKKNNRILLNGKPIYIHKTLDIGDILTIDISFDEKSENIVPTKMDLNIIFEDDCLIILNKPAGIPVHPSLSHYESSLSNGLQYYYEQNNIHSKIHPVNRLDKDTSRPCYIR